MAITAARLLATPRSTYFDPKEFGSWFYFIDHDTLRALYKFRGLWGARVDISQHKDAVARLKSGTSQHDILSHGLITKALDFFPHGMSTVADMQRAERLAEQAGFTGVGIYTDTNKPMMHGDTRKAKARWSRIAGEYKAISEAYV